MFIVFTGHRDKVADPRALDRIRNWYPDAEWMHGGAAGFDMQVEVYAQRHGVQTRVMRPNYADTRVPHKEAPIVRNHLMVDTPGVDLVVALWDGRQGGGTYNTILYAVQRGKRVFIVPPTAVAP
jgi:hypothetical protein